MLTGVQLQQKLLVVDLEPRALFLSIQTCFQIGCLHQLQPQINLNLQVLTFHQTVASGRTYKLTCIGKFYNYRLKFLYDGHWAIIAFCVIKMYHSFVHA